MGFYHLENQPNTPKKKNIRQKYSQKINHLLPHFMAGVPGFEPGLQSFGDPPRIAMRTPLFVHLFI